MTQSWWRRWDADVAAAGANFILVILSLFVQVEAWSHGSFQLARDGQALLSTPQKLTLVIVVCLLWAVVLERFADLHQPAGLRARPWVVWSRRLAATLPTLGLFALALWRRLVLLRPA